MYIRTIYRCIGGLLIAVLLLCGLEAALALGGYGTSTKFFIDDVLPGHVRTNPAFTSAFYPTSFGLKPENFRIPRKKPKGAYRVFVLGESAANGVPEAGFGPAVQLQAKLDRKFPQKTPEVYNLGVTAINSHAVRLIAKEALALEPDLIVLYMGNNEVVGPFGPGGVLTKEVLPLPVIRAHLWLRGTRIGQLLASVAGRIGAALGPSEWRGMEMFVGKTVTQNDPRLVDVYHNFESNLTSILKAAERARVTVVLCTVAVNLKDCAPFASVHHPELSPSTLAQWTKLSEQADRSFVLGDLYDAEMRFRAALQMDPLYADTHFKLGRILTERTGDLEQARAFFIAALRLDALRFRADPEINDIIRRLSRVFRNVTLVDAARKMGSAPEGGDEISGHKAFFEHVHLTFEGNHQLASLITHAVEPHQDNTATEDIAEIARSVGFTELGRLNQTMHINTLTARPPFTSQSTYAADRERMENEIADLKEKTSSRTQLSRILSDVQAALTANGQNVFLYAHLAAVHAQMGDATHALRMIEDGMHLVPPSPEFSVQRAYYMLLLKRYQQSESVLLESHKVYPDYFQTYTVLGELWEASGQARRGAAWFESLGIGMPNNRAIHEMHGRLAFAAGLESDAEIAWRNALRVTPDSAGAVMPLLQYLFGAKRYDEGIAVLETAIAYNPRNFDIAAILEQIYSQQRNRPRQIEMMKLMALSGPVKSELFLELGKLLAEGGERDEALYNFRRAAIRATNEKNFAVKQAALQAEHGLSL